MTTLEEFQFEILPAEDADDGVVFGIGADISCDEDGFHPGSTSWATQNSSSAANGVTNFGRDVLLGPLWAWDLHISRDDCEEAVESLAAFTTAWRAAQIRETPRTVLPIRYQLAGRTRRIYGRPQNVEDSVNNLILSGYAQLGADFQAVDGYTYSDDSSGVTMVIPATDFDRHGPGLVYPITLPASSVVGDESIRNVSIGGDTTAWGIFRFNGPWVDPSVYTDEWALSFPGFEIPDGQFIEVDTRPWVKTVLLNGTAPVGGYMGKRQKLFGARLDPGDVTIRAGGTSSTGTTCQISWRSTFNSI
jgi:hypothetical protein